MRILVLGGGGFIGRDLLADLVGHGHQVTAVVRHKRSLQGMISGISIVELDLSKALQSEDWAQHVMDIDLIVNAAGVLRGKDMRAIHVDMPKALYTAAAAAKVERAVLISAISARPDVATDYAKSKLEGEVVLRGSSLAWTILRPSLVYGNGSYGGTSLLRGMAALPWKIPLPGQGNFKFTPIHQYDLSKAIRVVCEQKDFSGRTLEPVGPETLTLMDLLTRYRAWLGFGDAHFLHVPMPLMRALGRIGDSLSSGPLATNSLVQMVAGNEGDSYAFATAIGFNPRSMNAALAANPAQVQDRWHAKLFFLAPVIPAVLVILWLASSLLGLTVGGEKTNELVAALGFPPETATPLRIGSSLLDAGIAFFVLIDKTVGRSTVAQILVVLGYTLVIGCTLPGLWLDPVGPLLKNIPILLLILVNGAIGHKR